MSTSTSTSTSMITTGTTGTTGTVAQAAIDGFPHSNQRGRRSVIYPEVCLERLAKSVNLSPGYVSRVMRGLNRPSLEVAQRIARCLSVSLDELTEQIDAGRSGRGGRGKRNNRNSKRRVGSSNGSKRNVA